MKTHDAVSGRPNLGATLLQGNRCHFSVWAPRASQVEVHLWTPDEHLVPMCPRDRGYYNATIDAVPPGSRYMFRLDGSKERPDPASRHQPFGVHKSSEVVDPRFAWHDDTWFGLPLREYVIYELHVGTFTPEGTFDAIIPRLADLRSLGITALELMPVGQFPGSRNWGYDGVHPFAVQNSYGGPEGLRRLVDACHREGIAVILDVIYNHLGPEGNYLADYGPYFTDRYWSPWGEAINIDGPHSDEVRRYFIDNALYWISEFHVDALRLDAIHAIIDLSAQPFLAELAEAVRLQSEALNRRAYLIAESDLNDSRILRSPEVGGYGLDAQWSDDFHHSLHALLTGETEGYYQDFGDVGHLARAYRDGYVYSGEFSSYRQRHFGNSSRDLPPQRFVVCSQNHDQVGNRRLGERLTGLVSFESLKLAAGVVLLSPFVPLIFMGEEYGEPAPFQYFVSHSDPALVESVRQGRREEFSAFAWAGEVPDPQEPTTYLRSKLDYLRRSEGEHRVLLEFYRELLRLRRELSLALGVARDSIVALELERKRVLVVRFIRESADSCAIFSFGDSPTSVVFPLPYGRWYKKLDSAEARWQHPDQSGLTPAATPSELDSDGEVKLEVPPRWVGLFTLRSHMNRQ